MARNDGTGRRARVIRFDYPMAGEAAPEPVWNFGEEASEEGSDEDAARWAEIDELRAERDALADQLQIRVAAVREESLRAAREGVEREKQQALEHLSDSLGGALIDFESARSRYFAAVEREVVELALAIAARILHREAQMDPLLLRGAVRVALGRLAESTEVQLMVPAADQPLWEETLQLMANLPLQPVITADEHLHTGECRLVAEVGSVDLGVKAQLEEIERGFFDLLERREGASSPRRISDAAIA